MHPDAPYDAHEIGHRRAFEMCARRFVVLLNVDVWYDHAAAAIDEIAILARDVVNVFLANCKTTDRRVQTFTAGGKLRDTHQHSAFIEVSALFGETDFDRGFAAKVITIPVRNRVLGSADCRSVSVDAAQILGLGRETRVFLT